MKTLTTNAFSILTMSAVVTIMTLTLSPTAHAEGKIGFVDMQKALQTVSAGKKAKASLETEFSAKKKEFEKKEAELKKQQADLEKKKAVMSEDVFMKKQEEFQKQVMAYREEVSKSQEDIQKRQSDLTGPLLDKFKTIIARVAKEKGYSAIQAIDATTLYFDPATDLTDVVIQEFDKAK